MYKKDADSFLSASCMVIFNGLRLANFTSLKMAFFADR